MRRDDIGVSNTLQLPFLFDVEKLKKDLDTCQKRNWVMHYNARDFDGDWTVIGLRAVGGFEQIVYAVPHGQYRDTDLLNLCPYFKEVLNSIKCPKDSIRLMQLGANSQIKEHRDDLLGYTDGFFRLHIPILTNQKVLFYFDGKALHMEAGTCWFGNFNVKHKVENKGSTSRVHLVVDCHRNEWSDNLFSQAMNAKQSH